MKTLIEQYIASHKLAWAPTTLKSEQARLMQLADVLNGNPDTLWKALETRGIKPYSRVTAWTRASNFWDWGLNKQHFKGSNPYKAWKETNARLFKNAYERQTPAISFEDAEALIFKIEDLSIQRKAFELLYSGLRYSESLTITSGIAIGKGGKRRNVYVPEISGPDYTGSYHTFWKTLNKIGLKPHLLRKVRATNLLRRGMDPIDLCEAMGWSNYNTARSYLAPLQKEEIQKFFK